MANYERTEEGFASAMRSVKGHALLHPTKAIWSYVDRRSNEYVVSVITPRVSEMAEHTGAMVFLGQAEDHTPRGETVTDEMLKDMKETIIATLAV